jgi:hypothetical protein
VKCANCDSEIEGTPIVIECLPVCGFCADAYRRYFGVAVIEIDVMIPPVTVYEIPVRIEVEVKS